MTTQRSSHPRMTHMQAQVFKQIPHEWAPVPDGMGYASSIVYLLVGQKLVETRQSGGAAQWRRRPLSFAEAVKNLCDVLPTNERALREYFAREELAEVRRQLAMQQVTE